MPIGSDLANVQGLGTLAARSDLELDGLALIEAAVALTLDVGVVDKDIVLPGHGYESVPLFGVEKLNGAVRHVGNRFLYSCRERRILTEPVGEAYERDRATRRSGFSHTSLANEVSHPVVVSGESDGAAFWEIEEITSNGGDCLAGVVGNVELPIDDQLHFVVLVGVRHRLAGLKAEYPGSYRLVGIVGHSKVIEKGIRFKLVHSWEVPSDY